MTAAVFFTIRPFRAFINRFSVRGIAADRHIGIDHMTIPFDHFAINIVLRLYFLLSHTNPFLFSVYRQYMPKKGIYVSNSVNINSHGDRIVVRQPNLAFFVLMDGKSAFDGGFIGENVIDLAACLLAVAVIGGFLDGSR